MKFASIPWRGGLALPGVFLVLCGVSAAQNPPAARPAGNNPAAPAAQQRAAQQPAVPNRVTANRVVDQDVATQRSDQLIASLLALANEEEVAIAKIAAAKTKNDKVRDFAGMLAKDHSQAQEALKPFGARFEPLGEEVGRRAQRGLRPQDIAGQPQLETKDQKGIDFLEIEREVAERCLESAKRHWSEANSVEADEAFLGMQIANHYRMIDKQEVLRNYASTKLQAVIQKQIEGTKAHLDHAKHLIRELAEAEVKADKAKPDPKTSSNR